MKTLIEIKFETMRRYVALAQFEASPTDTVALLSACAAMYYGDRGRIIIEGIDKPWTGELQLGNASLPFERFMLSIAEGQPHD